MPGLANRLILFEQLFKHLIRYIDWSKFEHCLSAKLVQGPTLVTNVFMMKSDLNLCAQKYTVCYVLAQIMVVYSLIAHLYPNKLQYSSKQKIPSRGMEISLQQIKSDLRKYSSGQTWKTWIPCFTKCAMSITCLTHLLDVFLLIICMLFFESN